ncbi:integrase, catalytic region, zinc finger, CCHC-type containing protein [Tanacetum coccineum]
MTTLADKAILSGADNRPPMLEKDMYDSWKSRMELYMLNRQNGRMILESVESYPLIWPSIVENRVTRPKKYSELSATEALQADCDIKATIIILQALPPEVYALVSNHKVAKELWERIQLLMQGTSLMKQEREYLHITNIDQLNAYLGQHEFHANESSIHHNIYSPSSSIPQLEYPPLVDKQSGFSQQEAGLIVPVFQKGDDPIDAINHMMSFLTVVVTSRYPTTNNQLRNSSNPRKQATINNGRVTLQPLQRRKTSVATGTSRTYTPGASGNNYGKQRTVICYNCKGEGHMSKQCTKPKRKRDDSWFKDKKDKPHRQSLLTMLLQADDLAAHDSDYALAEVHNHDTVNNNVINQAVQAMPSSEQSNVAVVQNSNSFVQQDALILSVIEQLKTQVVNCTKINLNNKSVNDTLTADLERYKEQVKVLKEGQNVDLTSKDNISDSSEYPKCLSSNGTGCGTTLFRVKMDERLLEDTSAGHRFSPKKTSAVYEKTSPRSCLRWKPTGKFFTAVSLKWIHIGKLFDSSMSKVDSEPPNGSNDDITNPYECDQTLNVSAGTLILGAGTSFNPLKESLRVWLPKRLISHKPRVQGILI